MAASLPQDRLIETAIAADRRFHEVQQRSLEHQADALRTSFVALEKAERPPTVKRANLALGGAWLSWLAEFIEKPDLATCVGRSAVADEARFVLDAIDGVASRSLSECRMATDRIADRLGIRPWYRWRRIGR